MTPSPDPADLPGPWPDVLAAYADGELNGCARAAVERWLAANPSARGCVHGQQAVSPENWRLWRDAEPPAPSPADWERVREGIAAGLIQSRTAVPAPTRGSWRRRAEWTLVTTACGLTLFVISLGAFGPWFLPPDRQPVIERAARAPADDPLAGVAVLPVAAEHEVDVSRVADAGAGGWLPVGGMPLAGPLALATADDVDVEEAEEHPAWPTGFPRVRPAPADMPVLFPDRAR